jgi:hypothetical protein
MSDQAGTPVPEFDTGHAHSGGPYALSVLLIAATVRLVRRRAA